jgi:hypothetical protein
MEVSAVLASPQRSACTSAAARPSRDALSLRFSRLTAAAADAACADASSAVRLPSFSWLLVESLQRVRRARVAGRQRVEDQSCEEEDRRD